MWSRRGLWTCVVFLIEFVGLSSFVSTIHDNFHSVKGCPVCMEVVQTVFNSVCKCWRSI